MMLEPINPNPAPLDLIVGSRDDMVVVEMDVRHNGDARAGELYLSRGEGFVTILRVMGAQYAQQYDPVTARMTAAIRHGITGLPQEDMAREMSQLQLVEMRIEGELHEDNHRIVGAARLPERLTPVYPLDESTLERFTSDPDGNVILGLLRSSSQTLPRPARLAHNYGGQRMVILGKPGTGKSQLAKGLVAQLMAAAPDDSLGHLGVLVLDRAGEYLEESQSQDGHAVFGLLGHPSAAERLVVVSNRQQFRTMAEEGRIAGYLRPVFNLQDLAPTDLADFFPSITDGQRELIRDYAHVPHLYHRLLMETKLGQVDKSSWYRSFPGLFELNKSGSELMKTFEGEASPGDTLSTEQLEMLQPHLGGRKSQMLERIIAAIKRFAASPLFGGQTRGPAILRVASCVPRLIEHLRAGCTVVVDMQGYDDVAYTLVGALLARQILNHAKAEEGGRGLRACIVMEEAQNVLAQDELQKGADHGGSVFIEYAREGRKRKLGLVLVTQQPDARSIAPEIAATIDTVIAFHMPPQNAAYLPQFKRAFRSVQHQIVNARVFEGVAVSEGGTTFFRSEPITPPYLQACEVLMHPEGAVLTHLEGAVLTHLEGAEDTLEDYLTSLVPQEEPDTEESSAEGPPPAQPLPAQDRLQALLDQRSTDFWQEARETMARWQGEG
jgi:DNA helicase HerA-like ATPase